MTAWATDDKEWMKARKEAWKSIKPKIDTLLNLEKDERRALKAYFLKGEDNPGFPLSGMCGAPLLEMWLHPDHSEEQWQKIKEKYADWQWSDARGRFSEVNRSLHETCPDGESFFDGLEKRFCQLFHFDRFKREDFLEYSGEGFIREAKEALSLARSFDNYLRKEKINPYEITRYQVQRWHDAMLLAYEEEFLGLEWMIESIIKVLFNPEKFPELAVQMAKDLNEVLQDPSLPDKAKNDIAKFSEKFRK